MNNKLKKILSSTLAVTLATATMFTTGIVVNATELPNVEKTTDAEGNVVVTQTENPTEYTTVAEKVEEALPEVSAEPTLSVNSIEEIDSKDTINDTSDSIFKSCRLIVTNPTDLEFKEESLGVDNIVSVQKYEDKYFVTYRSVYATEKAYNDLTALGLDVEIDVVQDTPEGVEIKDDKGNDIESKDIALAEETRPTKSVEDVVNEDTQKNEKTIVVAVLDTGLNNEEAIFEDKVIEGKNFVSEQSDVKDLDTHGTTMSRIVLDTTDGNVKILPIKVLNDEGKGTTLSVYKGIKYVIEKKKENPSLDFVINLSMSGIGHSKLLESAINEAYNNNIPVVVSAGNDNKEITEYTPANIDSAFTITSSNKNEDKITKAVYSNYGSEADYTTNGHYEYVRNIDDREVITKVDGTSVSSAYVSSYIALLKKMALSDDDEDNNNLSIIDIDTSLSESAIATNDLTLGNGYLSKENIHLKKVEEAEQEALPVEEISSEDFDEEIGINKTYRDRAPNIHIRWEWGSGWVFTDNGGFRHNNESITNAYNEAMNDLVWSLHFKAINFILDCDIQLNTYNDAWTLSGNGESIYIYGDGHRFCSNIQINNGFAFASPLTIMNCPDVTIISGVFDGNGCCYPNQAWGQAGALLHTDGSTINLNKCEFYWCKNLQSFYNDKNQPLGGGTAINVGNNTTLNMNKCKIRGISGASLYCWHNDTNENITINMDKCEFYSCSQVFSINLTAIRIKNIQFSASNKSKFYVGNCDENPSLENEYVTYYVGIDLSSASRKIGTISCTLKDCEAKGGYSYGMFLRNNGFNVEINGGTINSGALFSTPSIVNSSGTVTVKEADIVSRDGDAINSEGTINIEADSTIAGGTDFTGGKHSGISNLGTVNIKGGTIKDSPYGIYNAGGTCNIEDGSIEKNDTGIYNSATLNIKGGSINSNTTSGVQNNGTFNLKGGSINNNGTTNPTNWGWGIENYGTVNHSAGSVYLNGKNKPSGDSVNSGIYQDGTYNISGDADIDYSTNSVYLAYDTDSRGNVTNRHTINVAGKITNPVRLTTAVNDRTVGRKLVTGSQSLLNSYNSEHSSGKFLLAFANPTNDSYDSDNHFDGIGATAAVRTANGTNITSGNMCLSAKYAVSYNGLTNDAKRLWSYNPNDDIFYWKEQVSETGLKGTSKVVYLNDDGSETDLSADGTGEYEFVGWCEDSEGKGTIYTEIRQEWLDRNKPYYAIYRRGKAKVTYNPNGAVDKNGKAYEPFKENEQTKLREDYTTKDGSIFGEKQTKDGYIERQQQVNDYVTNHIYYITNKGEVVNTKGSDTDMYSFQGWSVIDYATSSKAEEIIYNGLTKFYNLYFDETAALNLEYTRQPIGVALGTIVGKIVKHRNDNINALNNRQLGDLNEFLEATGIVDVYAVWDKYPTIETRTFNISSKDAENLTDELLLDKIKVTDEEDGTISKDKIKLIYDKDQIVGLAEQGTCYTSITVVAEDSVGNVTKKVIMIGVNQVNPLSRNEQGFIRFISREAFEKSEADGGPLENSIWRTDEEYRKTMLENFDNLENNTPEQRWNFTHDQVLEVQDYIKTNGFGKSKSNESLENFYNKFAGEGCLTENRKGV